MHALNRLILIDSYKPGTVQEVRLDGPTNLNGINGAGKTTLLRLIPLFFGESPSRLVPKSRVNDSFVQHYLPNESSYLIFEYRRGRQTCLAVMHAAPSGGSLCYRFVDQAFRLEDFIETHLDGAQVPVSCRNLYRHLQKRGVPCSTQLSARNDYRTVIQNLPHGKGADLRQLVARYSFCESGQGRRLQHIEKIVTGMFMRSTDFRDLREMLASCIEEEKEAIVLDLKTDTLEAWCREYRALLNMDSRAEDMRALEQVDAAAQEVRQRLAELAARTRKLAQRLEAEHAQAAAARQEGEARLAEIRSRWETEERGFKQAQAETEARLATQGRDLARLEQEHADWERQDIAAKLALYEGRDQAREALDQARQNHQRLLAKVQDIDAEFGRLKAEQQAEFQQARHALEQRRAGLDLDAAREQGARREACYARQQALREEAAEAGDARNRCLADLKERRGQLTSAAREVQADPGLLAELEAKRGARETARTELGRSEDQGRALDARAAEQRAEAHRLEQARRQLGEQRQRTLDQEAQLQRELEAEASTLLGFLREHHPDWTGHIAKVIKPELLLRDDLSPALLDPSEGTCYGLSLDLAVLAAGRAASEAQLRAALAERRAELERLGQEDRRLEAESAAHRKAGQALDKQRKAQELALGQAKTALKRIDEELASLEGQIRASRAERQREFQSQLAATATDIAAAEAALRDARREWAERQQRLKDALAADLAGLEAERQAREAELRRELAALEQGRAEELAALDRQRLASLAHGGVDPRALADLEAKIAQLGKRLELAHRAADLVEKYQRWLAHEWPRRDALREEVGRLEQQRRDQEARYASAAESFRQEQGALKSRLAELDKSLGALADQARTLAQMLGELERYPRLPPESVDFDASHTLQLLQRQRHELGTEEQDLHRKLGALVDALRRALNQHPGTRPASYAEAVVQDLGLDAPSAAWLPHLRDWYADGGEELRRWLAMQANTFGSAVRNYQQALLRFDRGVDSLSRRLAASIDRNIAFDKIESIQARLRSTVAELGFWEQISAFTELYDAWQRSPEAFLPVQEFADAAQRVAGQLHSQGRMETRLVNLLDLEIAVIENGRAKRATHEEELQQISSHGLSYLILCVFFVALVNMIRRDQDVRIVWPMDELKDLHQVNIERLLEILGDNRITLLSAFPDPDPEVLKSFKNRYEIYGYRELVEMVLDEEGEAAEDS
jgi:hypothetical protein